MCQCSESYAVLLAGVITLLAGCGGMPPTQEMSDARQALRVARDVRAAQCCPQQFSQAREHLYEAELGLSLGQHRYARHHALAAKNDALALHQLADALQRAEQSARLAMQWRVLPPQAEERIEQSRRIATTYPAHALARAGQVESECLAAVNHARLATAQQWLCDLKGHTLTQQQQDLLEKANSALQLEDGEKAILLLNELQALFSEDSRQSLQRPAISQ